MNFTEQFYSHANKVTEISNSVKTEEATKTALIMPFFKDVLGYDVFNPTEFVPEQSAVMDKTKWGQIDYCIYLHGTPVIIIEAKHAGASLEGSVHQLCKYFASSEAAFAILTNGMEYRFYTDTEKANIMDTTSFLTINLLSATDEQLKVLELFHREDFDGAEVFEAATDARIAMNVRDSLDTELSMPSDDFVSLLITPFYKVRLTKQVLDKFRPYVNTAISNLFNRAKDSVLSDSNIEANITSDNHGYSAAFADEIRNILTGAGYTSKQFECKVRKEYFYVDYRRCTVCLFHYDEHNLATLQIQFMQPFNEVNYKLDEKRERRELYAVSSAKDVRKYADRIISAARDIDEFNRMYFQNKNNRARLT